MQFSSFLSLSFLMLLVCRSCTGFCSPTVSIRAATRQSALSSSMGAQEQKEELLSIISKTGMGKEESQDAARRVDSLIGAFEANNAGFNETVIDGEWQLIFTRNDKGSPSLQKALSFQKGFANFAVEEKVFHNIVQLGRFLKVIADVQYEVNPAEPNRLISTIVKAGINVGPLFIPLPFKGRTGWLDITYLDDDMRISRGNRGGLFMHVRPR